MAVRRSLVFGPPRVTSLDPLFPLQTLRTNSCSGIFQNRTPFRPAVANYKSPTTEVKQPWMGAWQSCQHVRICSTRNENKVPSCSIFGCCSKLARPASSSRKTSGWRPKQYITATARGHERLYRGRAFGYRCRGDPALLALGRSNAYHPIRDPKRARPRFACCAFSQSERQRKGSRRRPRHHPNRRSSRALSSEPRLRRRDSRFAPPPRYVREILFL